MNKFFRVATRGLACVALAASSMTAASAVVINSSTPYAFNWLFGSVSGDLKGNGSLTVSGFGSSTLTIDVTLNNTSTDANNRLTAFAFGIGPDATGATFADANDGGIANASLVTQLTGNLKDVEICAFSGNNNCNGGGGGGINGGASDAFTLNLAGTWGSSVTIDPIGFKYQTGPNGSFEFTTTAGTTALATNVPEPGTGTIALLGLALLVAGAGIRRRQQGA